MNEIVQRHMEEMTEEVEELLRIKLYTNPELKLILRMCQEYETKIYGISKYKKDFEDYIRYLRVFIKQIHHRRDQLQNSSKKGSIEYKILRRIKNIFENALTRFNGDIQLHTQYFAFCKRSNFMSNLSAVIYNMLASCSQKPEAFQIAAHWFDKELGDFNQAQKVLNKGITFHKKSEALFMDAVQLELSALRPAADEAAAARVCDKLITYCRIVFESVERKAFLTDILAALEPHAGTQRAQEFVLDKLLATEGAKAFVWELLAERERRGLRYGPGRAAKSPLELCLEKYEEGIRRVDSGERAALWARYLACLTLEKGKEGVSAHQVKAAFAEAARGGHLPENYYVTWLEHVGSGEAQAILAEGVKSHPKSAELWKLHLRYAMLADKRKAIDEIFSQAVDNLKELALPIWLAYLRYYSLLDRDAKVEEIYQLGIKQPQQVSQVLKPNYLDWLTLAKDIKQVRAFYNSIADQQPYCKQLHVVMLKTESMELKRDYNVWEKVHMNLTRQFGEDVDVWINYCLFFIHYHQDCVNINDKLQGIKKDALATLPMLLRDEFLDQFNNALNES